MKKYYQDMKNYLHYIKIAPLLFVLYKEGKTPA